MPLKTYLRLTYRVVHLVLVGVGWVVRLKVRVRFRGGFRHVADNLEACFRLFFCSQLDGHRFYKKSKLIKFGLHGTYNVRDCLNGPELQLNPCASRILLPPPRRICNRSCLFVRLFVCLPLGIGRWSASASESGSPLMGRTDLRCRP